MFKRATRQQSKLRMTIDGPAGSGKTYTALRFAHCLANGGKIAFIDTERGSASKYVGEAPDGVEWQFDVLELTSFSPEKYTEAIEAASKMNYSVLVIDSLSHAWEGVGGALEIKQRVGDSWSAWRHVTPIHNRMVDAILQSPMHVITSMRSKMDYIQEHDPSTGKYTIRKVGMAPVQRPGMEYEFDIVADIDYAHIMTVSKSRCPAVADMITEKPGASFMAPVIEWLGSGAKAAQIPQTETAFKPAEAEPVQSNSVSFDMDELVDKYGVDAIMSANNGMIPSNDEELRQVAQALEVAS